MPDPRYFFRPALRQEWIRYRHQSPMPDSPYLRAGVAGAYLPPIRLDVPHLPQEELSHSVPCCASMVLARQGRMVDPAWLADRLRTHPAHGTPGRNLAGLRAWGIQSDFPSELQFFRDGTLELNVRLGMHRQRFVYRWEERWLRYVTAALEAGVPPILFVDLGRLYPVWRGMSQRHAVVLTGGDGRQAWINDPARRSGPVRVGLSRLMDSLLPREPLAALLWPDRPESNASPGSAGLGWERDGNASGSGGESAEMKNEFEGWPDE